MNDLLERLAKWHETTGSVLLAKSGMLSNPIRQREERDDANKHLATAAALRLMIHEEKFATYSFSPFSEARVLLRKNLHSLLTQAFTEDKR